MSDLRVGLIGTGMMGCEHLRNLMGLDSVAITAVSDPNVEPLNWATKTLGDRAKSVTQFTSHEDLLASGLVDAVFAHRPKSDTEDGATGSGGSGGAPE